MTKEFSTTSRKKIGTADMYVTVIMVIIARVRFSIVRYLQLWRYTNSFLLY